MDFISEIAGIYISNYFNNHIPSGVHMGPSFQDWVVVTGINSPNLDDLFKADRPPTIQLSNPMAVETPKIVTFDEMGPRWAQSFLYDHPKMQVVHADRLSVYGEELIRIGRQLQTVGHRGVIVPLRGGLKPWLQLDVLTEMRFPACWLPFSGGANGVDKEQIRHYLAKFLAPFAETSPLQLAVVDTADSGHSSVMMAEILSSIHSDCFRRDRWVVHFYLLFAKGKPPRPYPPKSVSIPGKSNDQLTFHVVPHGVDDLICEDWDESLGIKCGWRDGDTPWIEVMPARGMMALRQTDGGLRIVEAERLDIYTDMLLGGAASESLLSDPYFRFSHDVWSRYLPKGATPPDRR